MVSSFLTSLFHLDLGRNRVHFDKEQAAGEAGEAELAFKRGDILQVTDTLYGGTVGSWQATKLSSPSASQGQSLCKGIVPNASRWHHVTFSDTSEVHPCSHFLAVAQGREVS